MLQLPLLFVSSIDCLCIKYGSNRLKFCTRELTVRYNGVCKRIVRDFNKVLHLSLLSSSFFLTLLWTSTLVYPGTPLRTHTPTQLLSQLLLWSFQCSDPVIRCKTIGLICLTQLVFTNLTNTSSLRLSSLHNIHNKKYHCQTLDQDVVRHRESYRQRPFSST